MQLKYKVGDWIVCKHTYWGNVIDYKYNVGKKYQVTYADWWNETKTVTVFQVFDGNTFCTFYDTITPDIIDMKWEQDINNIFYSQQEYRKAKLEKICHENI